MAAKQTIDEVWVAASPKSGSGVGRHEIDALVDRLSAAGLECRLTHQIAELRARVDEPTRTTDSLAVVAAGGDGTVALVAQNLPPTVPIVPMPMGTENLLARYWKYSPLAIDVEATILAGQRYRMDAGLANGRLFLVMVTAGMDAEVVRAMHLTRRGHISRWSYTRPILRALRRYTYPTIRSQYASDVPTCDPDSGATASDAAETFACWMMAFNLPRYAGGLNIEPDAIADDGFLDQIAMRKGFLWSGLNYLARIRLGSHVRHPDVTRDRVCRATWSAPRRVPYQIDGDYAGRLPVEIQVLPDRVTLLRPRTFSAGKPSPSNPPK